MVIAIVGSRDGLNWARVRAEMIRLLMRPEVTGVVSGGARGVDSMAESLAREARKNMHVIRADWDRLGRVAGFRRNVEIVANAEEVHAFWNGKSRGTAHTISIAKRDGKPVHVYEWPA